ncbi:MAG: hypothetical protein ABIQ92_09580 [Ornithinibacter sp.]
MITWTKAYRLPETLLAVAVLCALILWTRTLTLSVGSRTPVQAIWLLALGLVVVAALPLNDSMGLLERTFSRARPLKMIRAAVVALSVFLGAICLAVVSSANGIVAWLFLLSATTVLATLLLGHNAILVALTLGAGSIFVEHWVINTPITRLSESVGVPVAGACFGASLLIFVLLPHSKVGTTN